MCSRSWALANPTNDAFVGPRNWGNSLHDWTEFRGANHMSVI